MSKSNMLLGLAKGKVGDLVFYRDGGEQRTRTRVVPKNPRTAAQMEQRVKIANVAGLYRAAAAILKDSFSNRPSNQSGYNAFAATAIANAPYLTKQQAAAAVFIPQPAMMSRGVLPTLEYSGLSADGLQGIGLAAPFEASRPTTVGGVSEVLRATYPFLQEGDEINFCAIKFTPIEGQDAEVPVYNTSFSVDSLIINSGSNVGMEAASVSNSAGFLYGNNSTTWNEGEIVLAFIVLSRVDNDGKLSTSTQWSYLSPAALSLYNAQRSHAALTLAIESYKANQSIILR